MKNSAAIFAVIVLLVTIFSSCVDAQGTATSIATADPERAVASHNEKRRIPPSSDMNMLTWDSNLAGQAQAYAETCNFAHDGDAGDVGENIYLTTGSPTELYVSAVESWYNEIEDYDYDNLNCAQGKVCGHYTQVVWADSHTLGCGAANCSTVTGASGFNNAKIVICRYYPQGNFQGRKPYTRGEECTECDSGWGCNDGLCEDPSTTSTTAQTTTSTDSTTTSATTPMTSSTTTGGGSTASTTSSIPPSTTTSSSPTTTSATTTTTTSTTTEELTTSTTASPPPSSTTPSSTTTTTEGTTSTQATTTTEGTTSTQATQSTSTSASTDGSTISTTQGTSTTTESPTPTGCTAEYLELRDQWIEALNEWRSAFRDWRDGNCPGS